jgi:hypothetical protein
MQSKRIRSTGTSSVKWIYPIRWIEIERAGLEEKREGYLGFPGARRRRDLGQGVDLRRALVASGRRRIDDEVQHGEEVLRASTTPSITSSEEEEGWLESSGGAELWVLDGKLDSL